MDTTNLLTKFARIGARVKVAERPANRFRMSQGVLTLDVRADRDGEFFEVALPEAEKTPDVAVLDVRPADRHLLLMVREGRAKHKFLCGHDERHWFVAAVPESAPVGTVRQAKEALKPDEVRSAQAGRGLSARESERRKNDAYHRQGEWFFVPAPAFRPAPALVLRNEPIRRGNGGKPHWCEFCYREGGEAVRVCQRYPNGVTDGQYLRILKAEPEAEAWRWTWMRRNSAVYVRGRVRHADHKTITLHGWHRVFMNTEHQAVAMKNVAFLD